MLSAFAPVAVSVNRLESSTALAESEAVIESVPSACLMPSVKSSLSSMYGNVRASCEAVAVL